MRKILFTLLLIAVAASVFAGNSSMSAYLLNDSFPEMSGKGAACGAAVYGISPLAENPASIASIDNYAWEAMHSVMPASMYSEKLAMAKAFDFGSFGASLTYFDFGQFEPVGIDANLGPVFSGDMVHPNAFSASFSYAKKFESFSIGLAANGLYESLGGDPRYNFSGGLGFIFESIGIDNLDLGASVLNLGADDAGFSQPVCVKGALSYTIKSRIRDQLRLTAAGEYLVKDDAVKGGAGFDYALFDELIIRGGFDAGNKQQVKFYAGAGFKAMGLNINYAYLPDSNIGDTHKISLSGSFGKLDEEPEKPEGAKGGESFAEYKKSGDYYFDNRQYRQALKYYEYINLIYWKEVEDSSEKEKISFYQKLGICYYNIRDNRRALQYFERAFYFDKDNEILKHWIRLLK